MSPKKLLIALSLSTLFTSWAGNDKYRLMLTDDPSTTIMIGWNQTSGNNPIVHYGTEDFSTNWNSYPLKKGVIRKVNYKLMNNNFVKLTNLIPNTAYYFVIKDSKDVSRRFWFKTAPKTNERLSFIAGGDSRNNRDVRKNANLLVAKLKPHAVFFGGDMTNLDTLFEWKDWLNDWQHTIATDGRMFPIVPARGNHESSNEVIYNLFNTPSSDIYYALTFGKNLIRSYTLNSEITAGGNQSNWLANDLKNNEKTIWKMAQYHKPMRPHVSSKSEGNDEYVNWAELFYNYNVNIVCESDSHSVKSTWPIKPCSGTQNCESGFERDDKNGTVYLGEGCWGAPLRNSDDAKGWTRNSASFNQFKLIFIDEFKIEVRTVIIGNSETVSEVANNKVFELPSTIDIWNPSNGKVIEIINKKKLNNQPDIVFSNLKNEQRVSDNVETTIAVNVIKPGSGISVVDFKIDGKSIGKAQNFPFTINHKFSAGRHKIEAVAYNNDLSAYDIETIFINAGNFSSTVTSRIITSKDDVEEGIDAHGKLYYTSSDLELSFDYGWTFFGTNQYIGVRFQNLKIPKGATINEAYIEFTAEDSQSNSVHLKVAVHDVVNAEEFKKSYDVSKRKRLAAISWFPGKWTKGEVSKDTRTPNLNYQIQEIINKEEWKYGNSISFILWDKDQSKNRRKAFTYDKDKSKAARLVVNYEFKNESQKSRHFLITKSTIYPNPFDNILSISFEKEVNTINVVIYTALGSVIYDENLTVKNYKTSINTENFPRGKYFIKIKDNNTNKIITKQLIKN